MYQGCNLKGTQRLNWNRLVQYRGSVNTWCTEKLKPKRDQVWNSTRIFLFSKVKVWSSDLYNKKCIYWLFLKQPLNSWHPKTKTIENQMILKLKLKQFWDIYLKSESLILKQFTSVCPLRHTTGLGLLCICLFHKDPCRWWYRSGLEIDSRVHI